jgi:glycosyltransferase involved in cell wall biosynthesis
VRVAVVHEWVSSRAGSEQVFEALAGLWPDADLFALSADPDVPLQLGGRSVTTTWLDRPGLRNRRGLTAPLMPVAWRALGRQDYDLCITSHHAFAMSNQLAAGGRHVAYVHSPARYVWSPEIDARGASPWTAPARAALKRVDRRAAQELTAVAANSREVADRIRRFWGREAVVIHPPVDTDWFTAQRGEPDRLELPDQFLLSLGRWIPYKSHDLAIAIADHAGLPLVIAGGGPEEASLRARAAAARVPVTFLRRPPREAVAELLRRAAALLFPTREDFGMVPVEAMASGTPVIAGRIGGVTETVLDGETGFLVDGDGPEAYAEAVGRLPELDPEACVRRAQSFSPRVFVEAFTGWVRETAPARP